jgi:hypothetical protein
MSSDAVPAVARAKSVRDAIPADGLFDGAIWRISPQPFALGSALAHELESLGRVLLHFYRAVNLLYRRSHEGREAAWIAQLLDQGKPADLIALQRHGAFKGDVPRVIRPDVLLTDDGFVISELDSVPGGIGLTQWLNQTYAALPPDEAGAAPSPVIGGTNGMKDGFASILGAAPRVHLVVSEEAKGYWPEMAWLAGQLGGDRFHVRDSSFTDFADGDAVYRFFELFDLANVANSAAIFGLGREKRIRVTPPPKPIFEEKLLFALLWNRNLRGFWRQELGEGFFQRLLRHVPRTWVLDPTLLPPNAAYPGLELTDWNQLKGLSQRERELILKVSGYSEEAWGARGVHLGSDLSTAEWSVAVNRALAAWPRTPYVLQQFHRPRLVEASYCDFAAEKLVALPGRVRLCPYYFVSGDGDSARPNLGGVLATIVPADKKIVHGMRDGILLPCSA